MTSPLGHRWPASPETSSRSLQLLVSLSFLGGKPRWSLGDLSMWLSHNVVVFFVTRLKRLLNYACLCVIFFFTESSRTRLPGRRFTRWYFVLFALHYESKKQNTWCWATPCLISGTQRVQFMWIFGKWWEGFKMFTLWWYNKINKLRYFFK